MKTYIETERLILRDWCDEDREAFARMNIDPLVMQYFPRMLDRKASDKLMDRFQAHIDEHGYGLFAVVLKETGELIGFSGVDNVVPDLPFAPAIEMAWRYDTEHWGKGYATEAGHAVLDYAFKKLKMKEIVSFCVHDNARALPVIKKLGMEKVENSDFHYPTLRKNHPLGAFVLYRIKKS